MKFKSVWVTVGLSILPFGAFSFDSGLGVTTTPSTNITSVTPIATTDNFLDLRLEDPINQIYSAEIVKGKPTNFKEVRLPKGAISNKPFKRDKLEKPRTPRKPEKIHPVLERWLSQTDGSEIETLVINLKDNLKIPRFPIPRIDQHRGSAENKRLLAQAQQIVANIKDTRAGQYEKIQEEFRGRYGARSKDTFWLINAIVAEVPLGMVKEIAARQDVLYIEPESGGEKPPAKEVKEGRKRIVSDPYFNLGQTSGWIGLLDTGLRFSHTQFNSPSNIDFKFDCTDGTCNNVPDPSDDCWNHGTSSAAIISANNNQGDLFRGVTGITVDSFKVYPASCGGLNSNASVKAFEKAVAVLDRVIVAEMQGSGGINSSISSAADAAFDAGAVIIAANGNNGSGSGTVNAPANAHKVIGVGNFDVATLNQISSQSRGPTSDNRIKPDIQAPTNTRTASSASDTAIRSFGGTSGATPYASGAAALLRNWLRGTSFSIDPGQVYAHLILSGQTPYPFNNTSGAGKIVMPTNGHAWWGKTVVGNGATIDIPINVSSGKTKIEGALWWPESSGQSHNDIDLHLVAPDGSTKDVSLSVPSVFERVREQSGSLQNGSWKIRIRGFSVPTGSQTVYWAARTR